MEQQTQLTSEQQELDTPLVSLFRHNLWANLRLFAVCMALDEQQLAATAAGTYGPIYNTLRHIVSAEQRYVVHLTGQEPAHPLRREDNPDIATLCTYVRRSGEDLIAIAARMAADRLMSMEWDEKRWPVPASLLLAQALHHANEHRTQVMTILTQLGIEPPDLSGWAYIEEHVTPTPLG